MGCNTIYVETRDTHDKIEVKAKSESHEKKCKREENEYINLILTQLITVADGFITFYLNVKYHGSCISLTLCDSFDIHKRIYAANASMGALNETRKD